MSEKDYSYLILYLQQPAKKFSFFKVFDRLKTDFNKDNVVKLEEKTFAEDFIKMDVAVRIRDGVVEEFVRRTIMYDKEMKKSESNRTVPGWQFCHFFLIKEGLAFTFEQFKLPVNAHGMYQQLMSFLNSSTDSVRFNKFIDEDDFTIFPILDTSIKNYRQLMYETRISEFDFNNYVFARQIHLLFSLGNPDMAAELATTYIPKMMLQLQNHLLPEDPDNETEKISMNVEEADDDADSSEVLVRLFPKRRRRWSDDDIRKFLFIRLWGYCAASCVVEACEMRGMLLNETSSLHALFRRVGDLYMVMRFQMQIIGNVFGLSTITRRQFATEDALDLANISYDNPIRNDPSMKTTLSIIDQTRSPSTDISSKISLMDFKTEYPIAKRLQEMVQSQELFDNLYIDVSTSASSKYGIGKRERFVDRLNSEMASIRFKEGRHEEALILLQPQVQRYEIDNWKVLRKETQRKLALCEQGLGRSEYYVKLCVDLINDPYYYSELLKNIPLLTADVDSAAPKDALRVGIESIHGRPEAFVERGAPLKFALVFYNNGLTDFKVDKIIVEFKEKLQENSMKTILVEGSGFIMNESIQKIVLKERMTTIGIFQVKRVQLISGHLRMEVPIEKNHPANLLPQETLQKLPCCLVGIVQTSKRKKSVIQAPPTLPQSDASPKPEPVKLDVDSLSSYGEAHHAVPYSAYFDPGFLVNVGSGESVLDVTLSKKACLIVDQEQEIYLTVKNPSDDEAMENITVTFVPSDPCLSVISPIRNKLIIDKLEPSETKQYPIRIRAQKVNAGNCTLCSLTCIIEEFNITKVMEMSFYEPFIYFYHTTITKDHNIMLQVIIECTTPTPLDIVGYNLDPKAGVDLVQDFNAGNFASTRALLPEQALSFVFVVSPNHTLLDFHKSILRVSYQSRGSDLTLVNDIQVSFSTITHKPYVVSVTSIGNMVMGELCRVKFEVTAPQIEAPNTIENKTRSPIDKKALVALPSIMCEVVAQDWLIAGKRRQLLDNSNLVPSDDPARRKWVFELQVVPLVGGYAQIPTLVLEHVSKEKLLTRYLSDGESTINGSTVFVQPALGEIAGPLYPINVPKIRSATDSNFISILPTISLSELDEEISSLNSDNSAKTPLNVPGDALTYREFASVALDGTMTARTYNNPYNYYGNTATVNLRTMRKDTDTFSM